VIKYADQLYDGFSIQNKVGILIKKGLIKNKRSDYYGNIKNDEKILILSGPLGIGKEKVFKKTIVV
jgi:hypothetical protein